MFLFTICPIFCLYGFQGPYLEFYIQAEFTKQGWTLVYKVFHPPSNESRDWIVLINGYSRPKEDFFSFARFLSEHHGMKVLCLDNRGSGNSVPIAGNDARSFSLEDLAEDVFDISQHHAIVKAVVLGISMGGMIGLALNRLHPNFMSSLHLVSTTTDPGDISLQTRSWKSDLEGVFEQLKVYVSVDFFKRNEILLKAMAKQILAKNTPDLPSQITGASLQRKAVDAFLFPSELLLAISCPVYVYHGSQDQVIPPASSRRFEQAPGFKKRIEYPNAGHLLLAEVGKTFFENVADNIHSASG